MKENPAATTSYGNESKYLNNVKFRILCKCRRYLWQEPVLAPLPAPAGRGSKAVLSSRLVTVDREEATGMKVLVSRRSEGEGGDSRKSVAARGEQGLRVSLSEQVSLWKGQSGRG